MIQAAHPLTVTRRCELLDVARSTVYYHPTGIPSEDLALTLPAKIAETLDPLEISVEGGEVSGR